MNIVFVLGLDVLLTFLACGILGPAAFKLGGLGLIGWAARVPFYLLRLYIGPAVLLTPDSARWYMTGTLLGAALTLPLALWSTVPGCPAAEKWLNLASGILQGLLLAYTAHRLRHLPAQPVRAH
jgi:hypothetical protein